MYKLEIIKYLLGYTNFICLQIPKSAEEVNLRNPNDMAYVYSGAYAPLLCKLVEKVIKYIINIVLYWQLSFVSYMEQITDELTMKCVGPVVSPFKHYIATSVWIEFLMWIIVKKYCVI